MTNQKRKKKLCLTFFGCFSSGGFSSFCTEINSSINHFIIITFKQTYLIWEGRDRRCITASMGVGSRNLMAERSGQRLELRKIIITVEAHFVKTEY